MASSIVVLTGAGISAESGISTFRDPDGIWSTVDYRAVATPEGFAADPARVHEFYNWRRRVEPNAAHFALARLEREFSGDFLLVTQNVDSLHERAGSQRLPHARPARPGAVQCMRPALTLERRDVAGLPCPACERVGQLRQDVVWFGEIPYHMQRISAALAGCDPFVSIGTSGNVHPAASFVREARAAGARTVELNLEPSAGAAYFDEAEHGPATKVVPAFVEKLLNDQEAAPTTEKGSGGTADERR